MNAIILTAIWGVVMMLGGAFIKNKSITRNMAIFGLIAILFANGLELWRGEALFNVDVKDMLHTNSFNLTFLTVVLGCTLLFFLLNEIGRAHV